MWITTSKLFGYFSWNFPILHLSCLKPIPLSFFQLKFWKILRAPILRNICKQLLLNGLKKISPLLVLGKAMLDGRKHIWATNTLYFKYEPHLVSLCNIHLYQNAFCYFLQASEEGKNDNDIDFRVFWASYSEKTILDKEIKSLGLESLHILLIFSTFIQFIFILTK